MDIIYNCGVGDSDFVIYVMLIMIFVKGMFYLRIIKLLLFGVCFNFVNMKDFIEWGICVWNMNLYNEYVNFKYRKVFRIKGLCVYLIINGREMRFGIKLNESVLGVFEV